MPDQHHDDDHASSALAEPVQNIDWVEARRNVENREKLLLELIQIFVTECPGWLSEIDEALGANDLAKVWQSAHSIKGAAHTIGAVPLAEASATLERVAHAGEGSEALSARDLVQARTETLMLELNGVLASGQIPESAQEGYVQA